MKDRRWAVKQFMKSTPDFMTVVHNSLNRIYKKIKNQKNKITFRLKLGGGEGEGAGRNIFLLENGLGEMYSINVFCFSTSLKGSIMLQTEKPNWL